MTDISFCCLCASDEGVFLDIFTATDRQLGNRSFLKEFETCLSVKVIQDEALSSKICHRCAIELGQCNEFVKKYRRVYNETLKLKRSELRKSCCLCLSTAENKFLFTLAKDFRSRIDPLQKIYDCFNREITREEAETRSICISCRYNLDVLHDLRKLAGEATFKLQRIAESKAILANLPKTRTFVVNRKTTVIDQAKVELEILSDVESECSSMARKRSKSKRLEKKTQRTAVELKLRTCGQCHSSIEGGTDMYRLHSTGVTVCKVCWITMDPFKPSKANKRKRQNQSKANNTKLCAVFLTDVLSPASLKDNGPSKVERNDKGNPTYVLSDESSGVEEKLTTRSKRNLGNKRRSGVSMSSEELDTKRLRLKRGFKQNEAPDHDGARKRIKSNEDEVTIYPSRLRQSARSDSETTKVRNRQIPDLLDAKNGVGNKTKNLEKAGRNNSVEKSSTLSKIGNKREGKSDRSVESNGDDSASSGNNEVRRNLRKVRNKVPLSLKPNLTDNQKSKENPKRPQPRTPAPTKSTKVSKNSTIQSSAKIQNSKVKLPLKRSKSLMMVSFPFKLKDPYECRVCRTEYKNKVIGMKHEMTHFKQVEIKIEKLNVTHHFQTIVQNSPITELPDATSSIDLTSANEIPLQSEVPSSTSPLGTDEVQARNPNHDTEEEETVSPSKRPESIPQDDKSLSIDDAKETDTVSSSNGPQTEEPPVEVVSKNHGTIMEDVTQELPTETNTELQKVDTSSAEADSVTEANLIEENEVSNKSEKEELSKELDEVVNNLQKEDNHVKNSSDQEVDAPSAKTATGKEEEQRGDRDSGEELESDTDIRIVDSGSSAEDSGEQMERRVNETTKVNNVLLEIEEEAKPTNVEVELSDAIEAKDALEAELEVEAEVTSTITSENNIKEKNEFSDVSSQNNGESLKECGSSDKIENKAAQPLSAVNEILQEVIDLATAEVQKRTESSDASVPETLENISEEIKKTAEGLVTADEISPNLDMVTNKKTENTLKNHPDIDAADL